MQRVLKAASELGYLPAEDLLAAMTPKPMQLLFLLPNGTNRFLRMLGQLIAHSQKLGSPPSTSVARWTTSRASIPNCWRDGSGTIGQACDGIAFMALEHPAVREAVNMLAERGVPTVTLISDISMRGAPPMSDWTTAPPDAPPAI